MGGVSLELVLLWWSPIQLKTRHLHYVQSISQQATALELLSFDFILLFFRDILLIRMTYSLECAKCVNFSIKCKQINVAGIQCWWIWIWWCGIWSDERQAHTLVNNNEMCEIFYVMTSHFVCRFCFGAHFCAAKATMKQHSPNQIDYVNICMFTWPMERKGGGLVCGIGGGEQWSSARVWPI